MYFDVIVEDITKIGDLCDVIVNAANESLLGGGGVDGAIHEAAGPELLQECITLRGCRPGEAKYTKAYRLPQKYIIHTVGPRYYSCSNPSDVLKSCYLKCLELADKLGCTSIAFPSISTGVFGYPVKEAAKIACTVLSEYKPINKLSKAYMCIFKKDDTFLAYNNELKKLNNN